MLRLGLDFEGIRPHADPKVLPFVLFWDIPFWLTDHKIFLKAPNFEGERAPKKRDSFVKIFQKSLRTPF